MGHQQGLSRLQRRSPDDGRDIDVGRLIDRIGARAVMSIGTVIASVGLLALSQVRDQASYFAAWAVCGP